jgi:hypothetical protein
MGGSPAMLLRSFKRICAAARAILAAMDGRKLSSPMPRLEPARRVKPLPKALRGRGAKALGVKALGAQALGVKAR